MRVPSPIEEVDRKTIETLEHLLSRYEQGQISYDAYSVGLDAILGVVTGIVPSNTFRLLSDAQYVVRKK